MMGKVIGNRYGDTPRSQIIKSLVSQFKGFRLYLGFILCGEPPKLFISVFAVEDFQTRE